MWQNNDDDKNITARLQDPITRKVLAQWKMADIQYALRLINEGQQTNPNLDCGFHNKRFKQFSVSPLRTPLFTTW